MRNVARKIVMMTAAFGAASSLLGAPVFAQEAAPPPASAADATDAPAASEPLPDVPADAAADRPVDAPADDAASDPAPRADAAPVPATTPAPDKPLTPEEQVAAQMLAAGQAVLAENLSQMARDTIREVARHQGGLNDPTPLRLAASLLQAATTLNDRDGRLWQLLVEAQLQLGDSDGLLAALQGYRKLAPGDRVAQIQLIELYAARMEAADKELEYLRGLVAKENVPEEVRSHVSVMIARRLLDRDERTAAVAALDEALKLNPVNVAALNLKYELSAADASTLDRATLLLASLRANPVRPALVGEVGRLLASVGLSRDAADWMSRAVNHYSRFGGDPQARGLVMDYAAQLYLAGQVQASRNLLGQVFKADANDIDGWLLRLVIDRSAGDKEAYAASLKGASDALNAQWAAVAGRAAGNPDTAASTQPAAADAATPPADPAAVLEQVKAAQDETLRAAFVAAASDFAWFELYFNEQPGNAAKWVAALEGVLPEDNLTLQRLRGWLQLANNQPEEARKTLTPIADADPLAAMGLLRVDAAGGDAEARKAGDDRARRLLQENRVGLLGAILAQAFKDRGLKPEAHPDAAAIRGLLQQFPRGWLDIAENPQRFYSVRVDPQGVAHSYGQPLFAIVTISNLTDQPITIGEGGVIVPGLWFDAEVQAMKAEMYSGVAYERIAQATVLPPRAALTIPVRVDQGELGARLNREPTPRLQITGWCTTNVRQLNEKAVGPGPGGARVPFARKMTRVGFAVAKPAERDKVFQQIELGMPDTKIRNIRLLAAYLPGLMGVKDEKQQALAGEIAATLLDRMFRATEDPVAPVAQWARFELARVGEPARRQEHVEALLADARWEGRLLGLMAANSLGREQGMAIVGKFAEAAAPDEQPFVKTFAAQQLELLSRPPATTQPAEGVPAEGAPPEGAPAQGAPTEAGPTPGVPAPDASEAVPAPQPPADAPAPRAVGTEPAPADASSPPPAEDEAVPGDNK